MPEPYVCGTGGWTGPLPGDPDMSPASITLSAMAVFGGISVQWTYPSVNGYAVAHTLLYRGVSNNFAASIQRAVVAGNSFFDQDNSSTTYYYWIRLVSINGSPGELIGPAIATARPRSVDTLEDLTDKISVGALATSLRATLDNISMINGNLNAEIFDRETGETSFAAALLDVSNGVAAAHSFITTEINSRVTANSAIAEQINLVAVTLGSSVAAVAISADAWIDPYNTLGDTVSAIGALYTAKLTVNNLIGGFGIYNDGTSVDAGFDVDTFWIGRTAADKVLPFIIDSGIVYIDKARIRNADIDTLKIAGNAVTVPESLTSAGAVVIPAGGQLHITTGLAKTFSAAGRVAATVSFNAANVTGTNGSMAVNVYEDDVVSKTIVYTEATIKAFSQSSISGVGSMVISAGNHTLGILFNNTGTVDLTLERWGTIVLGTMR